MKTNKSYTKRIRVTKKGKLVARKPGQNHFNAKENRSTRTKKRQAGSVSMTRADRARYLAGS
jgi:ribosomal protein L35